MQRRSAIGQEDKMKNLYEYPTPMTDSQVAITNQGVGFISIVQADFARDLERQNAALREALWNLLGCISETRGKCADDALEDARTVLAAADPQRTTSSMPSM